MEEEKENFVRNEFNPEKEILEEMREGTIKEFEGSREKENLKKVEAALFVAAKWLSIQELISLTDINPILLKELLVKLQEEYASDENAIELLNKEDLWKMDVKAEYTYMVNKLATGKSEFTKAEQETLAVIAYKQPVKQSVIIKIRGNKGYDHVHKFIQLGLVKSKKTGHTNELALSEEFYEYFHVGNEDVSEPDSKSGDFAHVGSEDTSEPVQNEDKSEPVNL